MRKNQLKFTQKEKETNMVKFQMLLKNNENVTRKKPTKAQTMTVESSKAKYSPEAKKTIVIRKI